MNLAREYRQRLSAAGLDEGYGAFDLDLFRDMLGNAMQLTPAAVWQVLQDGTDAGYWHIEHGHVSILGASP